MFKNAKISTASNYMDCQDSLYPGKKCKSGKTNHNLLNYIVVIIPTFEKLKVDQSVKVGQYEN